MKRALGFFLFAMVAPWNIGTIQGCLPGFVAQDAALVKATGKCQEALSSAVMAGRTCDEAEALVNHELRTNPVCTASADAGSTWHVLPCHRDAGTDAADAAEGSDQ